MRIIRAIIDGFKKSKPKRKATNVGFIKYQKPKPKPIRKDF